MWFTDGLHLESDKVFNCSEGRCFKSDHITGDPFYAPYNERHLPVAEHLQQQRLCGTMKLSEREHSATKSSLQDLVITKTIDSLYYQINNHILETSTLATSCSHVQTTSTLVIVYSSCNNSYTFLQTSSGMLSMSPYT